MRSSTTRSGSQTADDRRSVVSGNSSTASTLVADSIASGKTATSQLRKFTAGVGRPGLAREAREAVRNVLIAQNPLRKAPISEPVDYEKFINERSIQLENDAQREIVLFPRDDIEEVSVNQECETSVPMVKANDILQAKWLLTREALKFYTSPHKSIVFNYAKFSGDYSANNTSSVIENETLSSLVFESDMSLEEERAAFNMYVGAAGIVKEGFLLVVKSDPTLFDNLKASKKRFCVLKRMEGGEITFEIRKSPNEPPKRAPMKVGGAQIKSTKKGKTVLEVSSSEAKSILLECDETRELEEWLVALQTAIAFATKEDAISTCSELDKSSKSNEAASSGNFGRTMAPDTESIGSEDSTNSRGSETWRGRNSAARALQPPIVDRRNMFSLYYRLQPLPCPKFESSTMLLSRMRPHRSNSTTSLNISVSPSMIRKTSSLKRSQNTSVTILVPSAPLCVSIEFQSLFLRLLGPSGTLQQIEPFYVRLFIFDSHECRRVCEEFHVLVNGEELHISEPVFDSSLKVNGIQRSLLVDRNASRCLVYLPSAHKDLWLVCRVDRVLSADTTADLYMKANADPKATMKLQKTVAMAMTRLCGHRQRFAWAAKPLFPNLRLDLSSSGGSNQGSTASKTFQLYRCDANRFSDADLQRYLTDFSKIEKTNKLAIPNGTVTIAVNTEAKITDFLYRVNPSLYPLNPWNPANDDKPNILPVLQLQTFGDTPNKPFNSLTNLLYIYPLSLKYDNQKAFSKARNIACTVRFVRGDEAIPEKAMVDRMSASGPYTISATCAVQHHQQTPTFGDEMKTQLPLNLTTSDHLLFAFSHISVAGNASVKTPESTETPIGYAWLPLVWKKDRLVMESDEQEFALPVAIELPKYYYRSKPTVLGKGDDAQFDVKWVDQKPLFRVRLRLVSSVFTTDAKLQTFFQSCDRLLSKGIMGDAADSLKRMVKSKSSSPSTAITDEIRSCSPIAEASMSRSPSLNDDPNLKNLLHSIRVLGDVPFERLISFFPIVLGRLFAILPQAPTDQLAIATLRSIVSICDTCCLNGKPQVVRRFVKYHFTRPLVDRYATGDATVHSVVCRYLPIMMREMQSDIDELTMLYRQLWVLTDIVMKSMAQTMCAEQLNKKAQKDRFGGELLEQMGQVLEVGVPQIIAKHREIPEESRCANLALAYFVRFALSFVDRGVVFRWIHFYISHLDDTDYRALREYKTDLLEIICMHEHFIPLNLPVLINSMNQIQRFNYSGGVVETQLHTTNASGTGFLSRFFNQIFNIPTLESTESDRYALCSGEWHLTRSYAMNHFLIGLLMQELTACLRETKDYRKRPISLLRNLIAKHSFDKRYVDLTIQRRIALLYAPVVTFALDHLHELETNEYEDLDATPTGFRSFTQPANKWRSLNRYTNAASAFGRGSPARNSSPVPSASRPPQMPPPPPPSSSGSRAPTSAAATTATSTPLAEKLSDDEIQDILICCLYILQRMPKRLLSAIWAENDGANAEKLLRLLELIVEVFKYRGKEHALRKTAANSKLRSQFTLNLPSRTPNSRLSVDRGGGEPPVDDDSTPTNSVPFRVLQLVNLSQEVALIVVDVAQTFAHQLASQRNRWPHSESLFVGILSLHLRLADDNWSESVRLHVIAALALFVNLFRVRFFEGGPLEPLYMLIEKVLIQMASRLPAVQAAAAALLQLILRNGYEVAQGYFATQAMAQSVQPASTKSSTRKMVTSEWLGRPGAQTGVALARLLGFQSVLSNSSNFERGLLAVEALVDTRKATSFDLAVLDLLRQLRGVMSATVALKDAANDPIRLADLHLQLADSYRGSAALRSAWFDTLAEIYEQDRWFAEASVCHAHSVAIIARELEENKEIEVDWRIFEWINNQIAETENSKRDAGNVQPAGFTTENLATKIDKTASSLMLAERFEAVGPLYRILVPILEKNMHFTTLVSVYAELQQTYSRAAEVRTSGKRHLGTYFRVRFFGETQFRNEHNSDWIYREMGLTSLAAFALGMKEKCQRILGHDRVQIEANELDLTKIDSNIAYVQVTHVEPVASSGEIAKNDFSMHTNVSQFCYECAMVENERKLSREPSISEQVLNRTVLTVGGVFPATRRRLPVVGVAHERFTPLEFACQKLNVKAEQIRKTLATARDGRALDVKGLQLLLQGAVLPTVNAGPLAYAEVFTKDEQKERYGEKGINELKEAFVNLMSACQLAIEANESAIGSDQQTYHEVLVSSFDAMHERLQTFFGVSLRPEAEKLRLPRSAMHVLDSIGGVRT
ncbi:unnamed protein product [Caenorhabditis bovis]|uniref:Uncharacterized protein n=1 Tax=Caenorhabditis bovis TaxID=2654633 RepID=A0A8S1EVF9_9PELO|nr:unnamed protein product [Caenorhabditis bovis]